MQTVRLWIWLLIASHGNCLPCIVIVLLQVLEARAINPGLLCVNVVSGLQFESLQICCGCCLRMQLVRHWISVRMTTTRLLCFLFFVPLGWFCLGYLSGKLCSVGQNCLHHIVIGLSQVLEVRLMEPGLLCVNLALWARSILSRSASCYHNIYWSIHYSAFSYLTTGSKYHVMRHIAPIIALH